MEVSLRPGCRDDFGDLTVGHIWQASENLFEVGVGIDAATPTAFDDGVDDQLINS